MTNQAVVVLLRRRLNSEAGLTQRQMAKEMGVTVQYLHNVIHGQKRPSAKVLAWLGYERRTEIVPVNGKK